jgi:hypothetical protein
MPVDARAAGTSDRVPDAKQLLSFVSVHDELAVPRSWVYLWNS